LASWKYPTFPGPGDANESYDAADFQNPFLALQTVTLAPKAGRGRVTASNPPVTLSAVDPALDRSKFLRLDLEESTSAVVPSAGLDELLVSPVAHFMQAPPYNLNADNAVLAILDPYPTATLRAGLSADAAATITAVKRKAMFRPLHEDHPNFNGSNALSIPQQLARKRVEPSVARPNQNIAIPYWEATGPWMSTTTTTACRIACGSISASLSKKWKTARAYKPLYAFLDHRSR